jgi:hypothetical protein
VIESKKAFHHGWTKMNTDQSGAWEKPQTLKIERVSCP